MPLFKFKNPFKTKSKSDKTVLSSSSMSNEIEQNNEEIIIDEQNNDNQIINDDDNNKLYKIQTMRDLVHKNHVDQVRNNNPELSSETISNEARKLTEKYIFDESMNHVNKICNEPIIVENRPTNENGQYKPILHAPYYTDTPMYQQFEMTKNINSMADLSALLLRPRITAPQQALTIQWQDILDTNKIETIQGTLQLLILHYQISSIQQAIINAINISEISNNGSWTINNVLPITNIEQICRKEPKMTILSIIDNQQFAYHCLQEMHEITQDLCKWSNNINLHNKNAIIPYETITIILSTKLGTPFIYLLPSYLASGHYTLQKEPQSLNTSHNTEQIHKLYELSDFKINNTISIRNRPPSWYNEIFKLMQNSPNAPLAVHDLHNREKIYKQTEYPPLANYFNTEAQYAKAARAETTSSYPVTNLPKPVITQPQENPRNNFLLSTTNQSSRTTEQQANPNYPTRIESSSSQINSSSQSSRQILNEQVMHQSTTNLYPQLNTINTTENQNIFKPKPSNIPPMFTNNTLNLKPPDTINKFTPSRSSSPTAHAIASSPYFTTKINTQNNTANDTGYNFTPNFTPNAPYASDVTNTNKYTDETQTPFQTNNISKPSTSFNNGLMLPYINKAKIPQTSTYSDTDNQNPCRCDPAFNYLARADTLSIHEDPEQIISSLLDSPNSTVIYNETTHEQTQLHYPPTPNHNPNSTNTRLITNTPIKENIPITDTPASNTRQKVTTSQAIKLALKCRELKSDSENKELEYTRQQEELKLEKEKADTISQRLQEALDTIKNNQSINETTNTFNDTDKRNNEPSSDSLDTQNKITDETEEQSKQRGTIEKASLDQETIDKKWLDLYEKIEKLCETNQYKSTAIIRIWKTECEVLGLQYKDKPKKEDLLERIKMRKEARKHKLSHHSTNYNIFKPMSTADETSLRMLTNRLKSIPKFEIGDNPRPFIRNIQDIIIDICRITPLSDDERYKLMYEKLSPKAASHVYDNAMIQKGNPNQLIFYIEETLGSQRSEIQEIAEIDKIIFEPGTFGKCLDQIERSMATSMATLNEDLSDPVAYQAYQTSCLTQAINRLYQSNKPIYSLMVGNGIIEQARKDKNYRLFKTTLQEYDRHSIDMYDETAEDALAYKTMTTNNSQTDKPLRDITNTLQQKQINNPNIFQANYPQHSNQNAPLTTQYNPPQNHQLQSTTQYPPYSSVQNTDRNRKFRNIQNPKYKWNNATTNQIYNPLNQFHRPNKNVFPKFEQSKTQQRQPIYQNQVRQTQNRYNQNNYGNRQNNQFQNSNNDQTPRYSNYCHICETAGHTMNRCESFRPVIRINPLPVCPVRVRDDAICRFCPELIGDHYANYCPKKEFIPINNNNQNDRNRRNNHPYQQPNNTTRNQRNNQYQQNQNRQQYNNNNNIRNNMQTTTRQNQYRNPYYNQRSQQDNTNPPKYNYRQTNQIQPEQRMINPNNEIPQPNLTPQNQQQ